MNRTTPTASQAGNTIRPAPPIHRTWVETAGYWYAEPGPRWTPPSPALVGLHGYAQTAPDFLEVIRRWAPEEWMGVSAQGFHQIWHPGTKKVGFSWMTGFEKGDNIQRNHQFLAAIMDELTIEGACAAGKFFLLGFSQGSSVAFRFAQRYPDRVSGVISASADLPPDVEANLQPLLRVPVLVVYGTEDRIVAPEKSLRAAESLRSGGVEVELVSFDRGHLIPSSLAARGRDWMRRALDAGQ